MRERFVIGVTFRLNPTLAAQQSSRIGVIGASTVAFGGHRKTGASIRAGQNDRRKTEGPPSHMRPLKGSDVDPFISLLQRGGHACERGLQVAPSSLHGRDDGDSNSRRDQTVFNGRRT